MPTQQRHADEREFEEAEAAVTGIAGGFRHQHVDGRTGERQQRARMRREHQRHEQLRGIALQPHRDHHHHRQQGGNGAVEADDGGEQRAQRHHQHQKPRAAVFARLFDEQLARPCRDAGLLQRRRHHEQRGDEHHRRIAVAGQRIGQRQEARRPQRQPDRHGDDDDRQLVRHEQHHRHGDDQKNDGDVAHARFPLIGALDLHLLAALLLYELFRFADNCKDNHRERLRKSRSCST